ncbi:hypothetical protein [Azotobacter salinestris]|uniref:hypothetical protein n=1 Tax=Azotobacter salinestris TaxID=69964 RepID=UPI001266C53D|nr:hypothetical protein [Azotobacter salinestris]
MPSHSIRHGNRRFGIILGIACLLVVSLASMKMKGGILHDSFHHGEYFASLATLLSSQYTLVPLTIHGALDYIPGLIAFHTFGHENYFFPTWLIYRLLDVAAAILLYLLAEDFSKDRPHSLFISLAWALCAPAFVGYRDVMLLLSIYLYFSIQKQDNPFSAKVLEVCFGVVVALGLFWSFDRGITAAVSLGSACLVQLFRSRLYSSSLVSFAITLLAIELVFPQASLSGYFDNVKILLETASQWSKEWKHGYGIFLAGLLALANALAIGLLLLAMFDRKASTNHLPNCLFFILLSLFLFKIGSNRIDLGHILMGLWGPLLASLYWYSSTREKKPGPILKASLGLIFVALFMASYKFRNPVFIPMAASVIIALSHAFPLARTKAMSHTLATLLLVLTLSSSLLQVAKGHSDKEYVWLDYLDSPPPNPLLVTEGVRWASRELLSSGSHCVFDLANSGVINGLTGLPACSRFTYPVYADRRYEKEMIDSMKKQRPKAIIYSSTYWSFRIDGKTMHARFPSLNDFLRNEYAQEKCHLEYCIRYLKNRNDG